tara:strand:- start:182 stop:700 length:519 start_codon:yes stop_codon:yes gene_type:complete
MENLNNQGKNPQQCKDSESFVSSSIIGILILTLIMLLTSCYGTYYISDAEYSDLREEHASLTYYDNQIYWGWHDGYYYYYGKPHYYPWHYYYNICPPSHYTHTTHIVITRPVNKPTHRPKVNTHRPNIKVKTNTHRNINVKTNVNRNNKVIIKTNNGSKRTNKTTIRRKPKK